MEKAKNDACPFLDLLNDAETSCEGTAEHGVRLAIVSIPRQEFCALYEPNAALEQGTIFKELDMPFLGDGRMHG